MTKTGEDHALIYGIIASGLVALGAYLFLPQKTGATISTAAPIIEEPTPVASGAVSIPSSSSSGSTSSPVTYSPAPGVTGPNWGDLLSALAQPDQITIGGTSLPPVSLPSLSNTSAGQCNECGNSDPLSNYSPSQAPAASTPVFASDLAAKITGSGGTIPAPAASNFGTVTSGGTFSFGQVIPSNSPHSSLLEM